jgi:ABC-type dipeptide/oligopeptide/nickel transport system ATPase subunit
LSIKQEWLERYPIELSGGKLQRFCIARALNKQTRYLIAVEISAMLDSIHKRKYGVFFFKSSKNVI